MAGPPISSGPCSPRREVLSSPRPTPARSAREPPQGGVAEAGGQVIVHEPDRLHEGITDRGPDEGEAALLEIAREGLGERRLGRHLAWRAAPVVERTAAHEAPQIGGEAAVLALNGEHAPRVADGALD